MPKKSSSKRTDQIGIEYTDKPVSGWGGLTSFVRFGEALGLRDLLSRALPDGRSSNNRVEVVDLILQLMATVLIGGKRFEHVERIRWDEAVRVILGVKRMGSASSLTRYLGNFLPSQTEHLQQVLGRGLFRFIDRRSDVLDLDTTVITRYGKQEGSEKGYNPKKKGGVSHHPLLGMLASSKFIVHSWLRSGSASPHRGVQEFLLELLEQLPEGFQIEAVRADSGFYSRAFLSLLERLRIPYVIAAKMSEGFTKWCASKHEWHQVTSEIAIADDVYESPKQRGTRRRMIIVRTVKKRSSLLFEVIDYEYSAYVTTLDWPPADVWRFYQKRGDCENRIKELKYDFGVDGFCLHSFAGTEAAFRLICFTFNLFALFKTEIVQDSSPTLGTLRNKLFVIGVSVGRSARRVVLRLGLSRRWRGEFQTLLERIATWTSSTAAQLAQVRGNPCLERPSPWRLRTSPMLFVRGY